MIRLMKCIDGLLYVVLNGNKNNYTLLEIDLDNSCVAGERIH